MSTFDLQGMVSCYVDADYEYIPLDFAVPVLEVKVFVETLVTVHPKLFCYLAS